MVSSSSRHNITDVQGQERGLTQTLRLRFFDGGFVKFRNQDIVRSRSFNGGLHSTNRPMTTDEVREDRYHKRYDYAFFNGGFIQFRNQYIVRSRSFNGGLHSTNRPMTTDKVREDRYHKRYDYAFFNGGFIQFWNQDIVRLRSFNGGFHSMNQSERIVTTNATTTPSSTKNSFNFRVNTGVKS